MIELFRTCQSAEGARLVQKIIKKGVKIGYNNLVLEIKNDCPETYDKLALEFFNPWEDETYKWKYYRLLTHSAIEYIFTKI